MDQRITVDAFERCSCHQGACSPGAEKRGSLNDKKRAQTLAAIEGRMAHSREEAWRARDFTVERRISQELTEQRFGFGGDAAEPAGKIGRIFVHQRIDSCCAWSGKVGIVPAIWISRAQPNPGNSRREWVNLGP
jgi:hypothetical protein